MGKRIEKIIEILQCKNLDGIFLQKDANIIYLSGFTNSDSYLLLNFSSRAIITDSRYTEQTEKVYYNYNNIFIIV
ncbi:aminopeptidase P family N-terminal domain-containing protein [Lutispora sp.]|uniref:aminopeptidase P family N-terminal domain-containing protein n=1 Tax=Lutispora sp. TaxID=2828727 RepID=UPI002B21176F|nr:aminopeptidase P family N-terminal domain-containing protein [Lutispora sp.]MEA4960929.1 aminopeptidase P family N-terminal domain-containing protein [Lutispora sp.]